MSPLRLGTRASLLAQCQSQWVAAELQAAGIQVELVAVSTSGDQQQTPIGAIGARAFSPRRSSANCWPAASIWPSTASRTCPPTWRPGCAWRPSPNGRRSPTRCSPTSIVRWTNCPRAPRWGPAVSAAGHNCCHARPDLQIRDIRGNVDTRLRKLHGGQVDAVVLAEAGLERLGLADQIAQRLPPAIMLPAVGQGAWALEVRRDDRRTRQLVQALDHPASHAAVAAERAMLAALHGGCLAPVAAWGRFDQDRPDLLILTGRVLSPDGLQKIEATRSAPPAEAEQLGLRVADDLLAQGAAALIESARQ